MELMSGDRRMERISIIDYGRGNILSVRRAFESQGAKIEFVSTSQEIMKAKKLVLPGVGAFKDGVEELYKRDLVRGIQAYCKEGKPFLGICLGMQMMLGESEEFGLTKGLGLIPGRVVRIKNISVEGKEQKVPHVGWNELYYTRSVEGTILHGITEKVKMYFVHSYFAVPEDESYRLADTYYGKWRLSAVIKKGNCYGTQFHPEKSGEMGLKIIQNFVKL